MISVCIAVVALATTAEPGPSSSGQDLADLAAHVAATQKRVKRLLFDCYVEVRSSDAGSRTDRYVEAFGHHLRFADIMHNTSPETPPWLDPRRLRMWTNPDGRKWLFVFERNLHTYKLVKSRPFPTTIYTDTIGWRPPGEPMSEHLVGGRRFFLIDVFDPAKLSHLELSSVSEVVDGHSCVLVRTKDGRDRLWICPDLGYALVRRSLRPEKGRRISADYRCGDFRQVRPGVWLPMTCSGASKWKPGEGQSRLFNLKLVRVTINEQVPDDIFQPKSPPGTQIYDAEFRTHRTVPGGKELLDHWVAVVVSLHPPTPFQKGLPSWVFLMQLMGMGVTVVGAALMRTSPVPRPTSDARTVEGAAITSDTFKTM